jgi:hypothetical protein
MKYLIRSFFIYAILLAGLISCSKEQHAPNEPQPAPAMGKLAKLSYTDGSYDSMYYNTDGTVHELVTLNTVPFPYKERFVFEYNSLGKVSRIVQNNGERYEYTYINGLLTAVAHYVNNQKRDFRMYEYVNGKLTEAEEYYQEVSNQPGWGYLAHRSYTYYPDGNLKDETAYSFDTVTRMPRKDATITYQDYDNKFNTLEIAGRYLYLSQQTLAKNNPAKLISKDEVSGLSTEFSFSYTYNNTGNPLTRTMQYKSGSQTITETVQYSYY